MTPFCSTGTALARVTKYSSVAKPNRWFFITFHLTFPDGNSLHSCLLWHHWLSTSHFPLCSLLLCPGPGFSWTPGLSSPLAPLSRSSLGDLSLTHGFTSHCDPGECCICVHSQCCYFGYQTWKSSCLVDITSWMFHKHLNLRIFFNVCNSFTFF